MALNPSASKQYSYSRVTLEPGLGLKKHPTVSSKCVIKIRTSDTAAIDLGEFGLDLDKNSEVVEVEIGNSDTVYRDLLDQFLCEMTEGEVSKMTIYDSSLHQSCDTDGTRSMCGNEGHCGCETPIDKEQLGAVTQSEEIEPVVSMINGPVDEHDEIEHMDDDVEYCSSTEQDIVDKLKKVCYPNTSEKDSSSSLMEVEVSLLSCSVQPEIWSMTQAQKLFYAKNHKAKGNEMFQVGNFDRAFVRFSKATKYLILMGQEGDIPQELLTDWRTLKCQCYLNISMCQLKYQNYNAVICNCTKALEMDQSSVKGLFRRGQAYLNLKQLYLAEADFACALTLEPGNKALEKNLSYVRSILRKSDQSLAQAMSKMFK